MTPLLSLYSWADRVWFNGLISGMVIAVVVIWFLYHVFGKED